MSNMALLGTTSSLVTRSIGTKCLRGLPAAAQKRGFASSHRKPRLDGKVAVITGAGGGIGKQTALLFAREGAKGIICADVNLEAAQQTVKEITKHYGKKGVATAVKTNVSKAAEVKAAVDEAVSTYGGLHIVFNNAGIMHPDDGDAETTEDSIWDLTFDINVKGVLYGCRYGIPAIRKTGEGGSIINTASFVGIVGAATSQLAYTSTKGAVLALTRELAVVHARENIRVNALCPGPLNTPLLQSFLDTKEKQQRRLVHVPMGRFGEATEMAKATLFLASDDSSYVTGTSFSVDGGLTAAYVTDDTLVDPFSGPKDL